MKRFILVLLLTFFFQNPVFCGCVGPFSDDDLVIEYNYALEDSVFVGKVVDIKVKNADEATIIFQVLKQFKGGTKKKIEIFGLGCLYFKKPCQVTDQFIFSMGQIYLVYANNSNGKLYAGGCSRTRLLVEGEKDVQVLDKIVATPNWSFDKEKISEFDKKFYLAPHIKEILTKRLAPK